AGHRADRLADPGSWTDEQRCDQHLGVQPRLAHQPAQGGGAPQPATAVIAGAGRRRGQDAHRSPRSKWSAMDAARPEAVCSAATPATSNPDRRAVAAVTGPMQKAGIERARARSTAEASRSRPRTVELLVKVTPCTSA